MERLLDEASPVSLADMIGHYKRSKFLAEQEAIQAAQAGQAVVILNPTTPVGANDLKPTPTGGIILDFLNRKFPAYVDTGLNLVDVSEVARTHADALTMGRFGERYILGGENLTLKQILDKLSTITGLPSPTTKVPHWVAMAFAFFDENFNRTPAWQGAACDRRGSEDGQEDDVCLVGQSGAGAWLPAGAGVSGAASGGGMVSCERLCEGGSEGSEVKARIAIVAAMAGELRPLVRGWKREETPEGVTIYTSRWGCGSLCGTWLATGQAGDGGGVTAGSDSENHLGGVGWRAACRDGAGRRLARERDREPGDRRGHGNQ